MQYTSYLSPYLGLLIIRHPARGLCFRAGPRGIAEQKPRKPGCHIIQSQGLNKNEIPSSLLSASNTSLQSKSLTVNNCFPQHPLQLLPRGVPV